MAVVDARAISLLDVTFVGHRRHLRDRKAATAVRSVPTAFRSTPTRLSGRSLGVRNTTTRPESIEKFLAYTAVPGATGVHEAYPASIRRHPRTGRHSSRPQPSPVPTHPSVPEVDRINDIVTTSCRKSGAARQIRTGMQQVHEQVQAILDEQHRESADMERSRDRAGEAARIFGLLASWCRNSFGSEEALAAG